MKHIVLFQRVAPPLALMCRVAVVCCVALQGCASVLTPMGENKYDCNRKENPDSPYCHSFKAVNAAADSPLPDSRFDSTVRIADLDKLTGIAPVVSAADPPPPPSAPTGPGQTPGRATGRSDAGSVTATTSSPLPKASSLEGIPVRIGPLVQRVWIKRHVDSSDMLVGDTYVYREVTSAHWAGFEQIDADGHAHGAYPHWPAQPAVPKSAGAAAVPAAARAPAPQFSQPGAQAPAGGMAPAPANESGASSMPQ